MNLCYRPFRLLPVCLKKGAALTALLCAVVICSLTLQLPANAAPADNTGENTILLAADTRKSSTKKQTKATASSKKTKKTSASKKSGTSKKSSKKKKAKAKAAGPRYVVVPEQPFVPDGPSPVEQMMANSGRNTVAQQPEANFVIRVPESVGDGEAFPVEFGAEGVQSVTFKWRGKTVTSASPSNAGTHQALLPVALDENAKKLPLVMEVNWQNGKKETFTADVPVVKRRYPVQRLKVNPKFVSPPAEMAEKIKQDRAEMRAVIKQVSPKQYWTLPFYRPVPGEVTSLFGLRREFNGIPKSPHRGVDFHGSTGEPIHALDHGVVTLVSEQYYGGNTVVVDHGLGVQSVYLHLSQFSVSTGDTVQRGQVVGLVGSTGRVTGPHLHLSMYVLGESVNAAACIDMLQKPEKAAK